MASTSGQDQTNHGGSRGNPVRALLRVHHGESWTVLLSGLYFFFILFSYYLLRPVREAMGIQGGVDKLPWVMTCTLAAMALANPLFAWLVSRFPRRIFIPSTYHFFAANMLVFFVLFRVLPDRMHTGLGYCFYVWLSVFNLFVISVFWGFNADIFSRDQAKRLFGVIAIGGTLGGIAGPVVTSALVKGIDIEPYGMGAYLLKVPGHAMLMVSIVALELAVVCVMLLSKRAGLNKPREGAAPASPAAAPTREPGPGMWKGLAAVIHSNYLRVISLYMLLFSVSGTLLYIEQARTIEAAYPDKSMREAAFADIDLWSNVLTLVTQFLLTGRIISLVGLGGALCILPIVTLGGFIIFWQHPTLAVLMWFQVIRRGMHYAVDRPAREVLYTVLSPDEKYKAKSFIDTFVYRAGDMIGGWTPTWWGYTGVAIGWLAVPISFGWLLVGGLLGHLQKKHTTPERPGHGAEQAPH